MEFDIELLKKALTGTYNMKEDAIQRLYDVLKKRGISLKVGTKEEWEEIDEYKMHIDRYGNHYCCYNENNELLDLTNGSVIDSDDSALIEYEIARKVWEYSHKYYKILDENEDPPVDEDKIHLQNDDFAKFLLYCFGKTKNIPYVVMVNGWLGEEDRLQEMLIEGFEKTSPTLPFLKNPNKRFPVDVPLEKMKEHFTKAIAGIELSFEDIYNDIFNQQIQQENNILDIIIKLVEGTKNNNILVNGDTKLINCKYLLDQTIRLYQTKNTKYFVSKKANELWKSISSKKINDYRYKDFIVVEKDSKINVKIYKGAQKAPIEVRKLVKGERISFNKIFTEEHIVPVNMIRKELLELTDLNYESVAKILDKIAICRLLKEEDKKIVAKSRRSTDYKKAITENYLPVGIKIDGDWK